MLIIKERIFSSFKSVWGWVLKLYSLLLPFPGPSCKKDGVITLWVLPLDLLIFDNRSKFSILIFKTLNHTNIPIIKERMFLPPFQAEGRGGFLCVVILPIPTQPATKEG